MNIDNIKYSIRSGKKYNMLLIEADNINIVAWAPVPEIPKVPIIHGTLSDEDIRALTDREHASLNLPHKK